MKIQDFKDLDAWKVGHSLVILVYKITDNFPQKEIFGLISQMRRCAVSITSNVAEGFTRKGQKEKIQFYYIAKGSLIELENQLLIAKDVGYLKNDDFDKIMNNLIKTKMILNGLIRYCNK